MWSVRGVVALFWHCLEVRRSRQDGGLCGTMTKTLVIVSGELGTLSALPPQQSEGNTEPGLSPLRRDREELPARAHCEHRRRVATQLFLTA